MMLFFKKENVVCRILMTSGNGASYPDNIIIIMITVMRIIIIMIIIIIIVIITITLILMMIFCQKLITDSK